MRIVKLFGLAVLSVVWIWTVTSCGSGGVAEEPVRGSAAPTVESRASVSPSVARVDPGVEACRMSAKRASSGVPMTPAEKARVYSLLSRSGKAGLRKAGAAYERAEESADVDAVLEAAGKYVAACELAGVHIEAGNG
jgi:hypothetical protein